MKKLAINALSVVSELGPSQVFLTVTVNPEWPDLKDALPIGQTVYDNPSIVDRIFKKRLDALIHNLRQGKYFGGKKTSYDLRVTEYQNRGLPHAHIVCQLENVHFDINSNDELNFINQHFCTVLPDKDLDPHYYNLVKNKMTHKHSKGVNGCMGANGKGCNKGFDKTHVCETSLDAKGYPTYRRDCNEDLMIVVHNRQILIDWDGHACCEYSGSTYTLLYLYSYLFKGQKKVKLNIASVDKDILKDEHAMYIKGRKLCSHDAVWRILGYQTYPASNPKVIVVKVRTQAFTEVFMREKKLTHLVVYFSAQNLNAQEYPFVGLTFKDFFQKYTVVRYGQAEVLKPNMTPLLELNGKYGSKGIAIRERSARMRVICRVTMVSIKAGELWYLRTLLLHHSYKSFKMCKDYNGNTYQTYQEAAIAAGHVNDGNEAKLIFDEIKQSSTPNQLRNMFILLTSEGYPTLKLFKTPEYYNLLIADYRGNNAASKKQKLLEYLYQRLRKLNKDMHAYGFDKPNRHITELDEERQKYPQEQQAALLQQLCETTPMIPDQQLIFDTINDAIANSTPYSEPVMLILQASAGCGKTTTAVKIASSARSKGYIVKICCSTAIAALNYKSDATTAHSLFGFPVIDECDRENDDEKPICFTSKERKEILKETKLIIWDEFFSNNKEVFEGAFESNNGFKGKVILCISDGKQCFPVIAQGSKEDIMQNSILNSCHFPKFKLKVLSTNMRLRNAQVQNVARYVS